MENASKALLIAGAILLVIAIIAIGIGIVNKTRGSINIAKNQVDGMSVEMFNKQFEKYAGIGKRIEDARELLIIISNYNSKQKNQSDMILIHEHLKTMNEREETYSGGYHYKTDFIKYAYAEYNSSYFKGKPIQLGTIGNNNGKLFNIKFTYNQQGVICRVDFYRYYQ